MATRTEPATVSAPPHGLRRAVHVALLESVHGGTGVAHTVAAVLIALAIVMSVAVALIGTLPDQDPATARWLSALRWVAAIVFTGEFLLRLWSVGVGDRVRFDEQRHPVWSYLSSPYGIIDLVSALPFWADEAFGMDGRWLAFAQLIPALKLARYAPGVEMVAAVIKAERRPLAAALLAVLMLLLFASGLMYVIEHAAQPRAFASIPHALWWGIVTIASVGYGDVVPQTPWGKLVGGFVIFVGIALFAVPAGILASGFAAELRKREAIVGWKSVAQVPLFHGLEATRIAQIARLLKRQPMPADTVIVERGDTADAMYFILSGEVEVALEPTPVRLGKGQYFGEIALLRDTARTATVTAVENTELLVLEVADFRKLIELHPDLKARIERIAAERLGQR